MEKNIAWCPPDADVRQALMEMQQHDTGYLLIGEKETLEGIVSRSDITGAISPYIRSIFIKWRRPQDDATLQIKLKWIMSRPVHTIKPDTSLADIMEIMCRFGCRCLPVINKKGKVEGTVTVFDIFRVLNESLHIETAGKTLQAPFVI